MPRTRLEPIAQIATLFPADWSEVTDSEKTALKDGVCEILTGLHCECNGHKRCRDSVETTIKDRIRAKAIVTRVDIGIKELATARGVDIAVATNAEIIAVSSPDEINSLIAYESLISPETILSVVTNEEMAAIEREELSRNPAIRDPSWEKDISGLVGRSTPHPILVSGDGIPYVVTSQINLATLRPEVDDNGEICAWNYENV